MSDSKDPTSPFAPLDNKGWLDPMPRMDLSPGIDAKDAEITRLRAALADAQAVGFAAGVEAAAKVSAMQAVYTREAIKRATASELVSNLVTVTKSRTAHDIEIAIRALVRPDATAAAARVLLADLELALSTEIGVAGGKEAGRRWSTATAMSRSTPIRMIRAALRAIAGDTP